MENPTSQTSSNIESANRAWATEAADDKEVLVCYPRGVQADAGCSIDVEARSKVNGTILTEASDRLAGCRIQRVKIIAHTGKNPLFPACVVLPENKPTLPSGSCP